MSSPKASGPAVGAEEATGYPCPECGAATSLAPGTEALACAHCGATSRIEASSKPIVEYDLASARARLQMRPADQLTPGGAELMCKNCGARTMVTKQATRCAFCDEPMVVPVEQVDATVVPESVLPFELDQGRADAAFQAWLASRWFAPSDLARRARRDGLDGVYLPYWTYDSRTTTRYTGQRGDYYYVTVSYRDSQGKSRTRQERRTRWSSRSGTVRVAFDDVLVCATRTLPGALIERLEPWDLPALKPFDGRYLAGFTAERYQIEVDDGFELAEARMEPEIRAAIRRDIGGDTQRIHSMHVHHANTTFKHILLPMWISSFRYGERVFRITVNARTGEVAGERPWSVWKILFAVLVVAAIIGGLIWVYQHAR